MIQMIYNDTSGRSACQRKRAKGGRKSKLSLDDLLMVTIQYMRE